MDANKQTRKRPAPRGTAAYSRKRAVSACQTCRSRKTKCDNKRPSCSFCEVSGATCIYSTHDLSAYDPASLAILDRLDQLENSLKTHISSNTSVASNSPSAASANTAVVGALDPTYPLQAKHLGTGSDLSISTLANTIEHVLSWPAFNGRFRNRLGLVQLLKASEPQNCPTNVNFDLEPETCKYLVEQCLEHILSKNPIIEESSLRKIMNSVCFNGIGWDANSCLSLLVCALGSIASPDPSRVDWAMARAYFGAAQRRIGFLMNEDGLIAPQCYFLAGVYFMYNLRPLEAWRMFAQGVVHIQPDAPDSVLPGQYSLIECVYWSCWKSEVELRMNLRLPSFGVISNQYPSHMPEPPATDSSQEPKWFYYLADISLRRLDMNIRDTVATILERGANTTSPSMELAHAAPMLEEQLQDWAKSMPDVFNIHDPEESMLHFILKGRLLDSYDVLYIPFLEECLAGHHPISQETGSMLEVYARKALDCCVKRILELKSEYTFRHHGTWLMLRAHTRSTLMLLATHIAGRSDLLPEQWRVAVVDAVEVISPWKDESYDVADRLAILRDLSMDCGLDLPV